MILNQVIYGIDVLDLKIYMKRIDWMIADIDMPFKRDKFSFSMFL